MKRRLLVVLSALVACLPLLTPLPAQAASRLSVSPSSVNTEVSKTFTVNINVNAGEAINSASGTVTYPSSLLEPTSVSTGGSIFSFWTETPGVSSLKFGGGLPNPGHVGTGKIFSITFRAKQEGSGTISIASGKVLANDGNGTNVYAGASASSVKVTQPLSPISLSSSSHPSSSQWYQSRNLSLKWTKPSDVTSFSYTLQSSTGAAGPSGTQTDTTKTFSDLGDGVWTFTVTGSSPKGDRSASLKAQIDGTAPEKFEISVTQTSPTDPFPVLSYSAKDAASGIDHYEITVQGQAGKTTNETTLKLDRQVPGKRQVTVKAFDKAGNVVEAQAEFTVKGFPGPVITDFSRFVSVLQPVSLKGTALYGAKIRLYVDGKEAGEFAVKENLTDYQRQTSDPALLKDEDTAEWNYFYKEGLLPGNHTFYAVQIKPDTSESDPSNSVTPRVLWSSLSLFGITIPLALAAIGLLALVIVLLIILIWTWRRSRRTVGNWKSRLLALKRKIDGELQEMKDDVHGATDDLEEQPRAMKNQITAEIKGTINQIDESLDKVIELAEQEEKKDDDTKAGSN